MFHISSLLYLPHHSPNPWHLLIFLLFVFSKISGTWDHMVYIAFQTDFFLLATCILRFSMSFYGLIIYFLLVWNNVPLEGFYFPFPLLLFLPCLPPLTLYHRHHHHPYIPDILPSALYILSYLMLTTNL